MPSTDRIPVTVLTGFLGSGKTTLLNRLLAGAHGQRIAVIENEFGEVDIDSAILVRDTGTEIVQTENGCLCCTVRGDLRRALVDLAQRRAAGSLDFERVVIETTGLAQPAPVVQTILIDPALGAHYRLDGVVTLVDAKHGDAQLDAHVEAQEQVGFADRLVISKPDLASDGGRAALEARLKDMNPRAAVRVARFGDAPVEWVTGVGGFDANAVLELHPGFPRYVRPAGHTPGVESFVWRSDRPFDRERFEFLLRTISQWYGADLLRYKGILGFDADPLRWVFQGVHRQQTLAAGRPWASGEPRGSVLVFIGIALPREVLGQGLDKCLAGAAV
jgi:G3E family GTPase